MKQTVEPQILGLNSVEGMRPSGFLTEQDLQKEYGIHPNMNQGISNIPDMHLEPDLMIPKERRSEIKQEIDIASAKLDNIEERIREDVEKVANKTSIVGNTPKDVLKSLITQGQYTKDFKLFGHTWTLRALDQMDQMLAAEDLKDSSETLAGRYYNLAFNHIVYAIDALDGIGISQWFPERTLEMYGGKKEEYIIALRRDLRQYLQVMPPFVIDSLYEKYQEVNEERNKALEELKNS
jgi:hypothetical protein